MRTIGPFLSVALLASPSLARADEEPGYHPYFEAPKVRTVDLSQARPGPAPESGAVRFDQLDEIAANPPQVADPVPGHLPDGLVQQGSVVVPAGVADGSLTATHRPLHAVEDIPGNEYPRKHTVFLNFSGGMLYTGSDNSAEDRSSLAKQGVYPTFTGGEATALAAVQAFENDVSQFGIEVEYLQRPSKTVPFTMVMIGGSWTDTNIEDPAGGVAPGTDCGALGQRHVVYVFANGGWGGTQIANVSSQEAGHAWGLDHSFNCNSVMAYCGGGDQFFSNSCDGVCEQQCQGKAGCFSSHAQFCGPGEQNEGAELSWIFGGNEPDLEPPTVTIESPIDGSTHPDGADVPLRAQVDDNYGGYGWKFLITKDGETLYDEVDYGRDVDDEYRAALNLANLEPGSYTITVEIEDHFEHVTQDMVAFTVEGEVDAETGSTSGGDESSGGVVTTDSATSGPSSASGGTSPSGPDSTGGASDSEGQTGVEDDSDDSDDDESDDGSSGPEMDGDIGNEGCQCSANQDAPPWGMLFLVPLLGWGLSRRSRTRTRR